MRFFDRKTSLLIVLFCLPLLFLPKINLIKFGGESAGIRIDDLILVCFALILFWAHFGLEKPLRRIEWWMIGIIAASFFSYILNRIFVSLNWLHVDAKLFYCVRLFEYFLFFYIGIMASQFFRISTVVRAFFIWNMAIMILQKVGLMGMWSVDGFSNDATYRVTGIASFPSEMGALLNIIFCFLIYDQSQRPKIIRMFPPIVRKFIDMTFLYWVFLLFAVLVIYTGSRVAVAALVLSLLFKLKEELSFRSPITLFFSIVFIVVGAFMMFYLIMSTYSILHRSMGLISLANFELAAEVWEHIDLSHDPIGNESVAAIEGAYDMSWWMRIHKWCYALKIYYLHPECYLQGVGPGFAMGGLDGGFLRILTENGLIGCFLYWMFFREISKMSKQLKWMMVAFCVNMVFFDVYLAYKPMTLLFLVTGYAYSALRAKSSVEKELQLAKAS